MCGWGKLVRRRLSEATGLAFGGREHKDTYNEICISERPAFQTYFLVFFFLTGKTKNVNEIIKFILSLLLCLLLLSFKL